MKVTGDKWRVASSRAVVAREFIPHSAFRIPHFPS
jgi:hypothetical protein